MKNSIEQLITENFESEIQDLELPSFNKLAKGVCLIEKRKTTVNELPGNDFYFFIAKFLNIKIKMYQAIIVFVVVAGVYIYYADAKTNIAKSNTLNKPIEITVPAHSYTVMACVKETKII